MPRLFSILPFRLACAVAVLATTSACKPQADGVAMSRAERSAQRAQRRGSAQRSAAIQARAFAPSNLSNVTARKFNTDAPYTRHDGWLVRGTDLLLFLPCVNDSDYYIVAAPAVQARLKQFYRFATTRPYIPVYVELSSRLIDDTLTVGDYLFKRVIEVKDFRPDQLGAPTCGRPPNGKIMAHARQYEPNL